MGSKNISLTEEAYERLKERKKKNQSFTELILEMTKENKNDFSNLIGIDLDVEWEEIKKDREKSKKDEKREKILFRH